MAQASPAGPAPTTRTSTSSSSRWTPSAFRLTPPTFGEPALGWPMLAAQPSNASEAERASARAEGRRIEQERVGRALDPERGRRAVSRQEAHVVAEDEQPLADRADERVVVAAWEVRAPDRALEEHVAHQREARRTVEEDHVAGGVARAVLDLELELADRHALAALEPAVGLEGASLEAKQRRLLRQAVDPEALLELGSLDRQPEALGEVARGARVVDVPVREQDLLELDPARGREQALGLAARIDQRPAAAPAAAQDAAVLPEGRDGHDLDLER